METRRGTRQVFCGGVAIGGDAAISIQSMTNTDTADVAATVAQISALTEAGCQIVRCAVPNQAAAEALPLIKRQIGIPLVADIHFDYRLALAAIDGGADKIRINPGNIGGIERLRAVVDRAKAAGIPMRVGVNGGSLEKEILTKHGGPTAAALAESALLNEARIREMGFENMVLSIKSSDVRTNQEAHRLLAAGTDLPLHIGITEAGFGDRAVIKSAIGIGALLLEGIGDTIRVSLTGDPVQEIAAARSILATLNLLPAAITVISCPTCGRCKTDLARLAAEISRAASEWEGKGRRAVTVAVMGCAVNGPGEAAHADVGVACGDGNAVLFKDGQILRTISTEQIVPVLLGEIGDFCRLR